jgi:hypothetical protein
MIQSSQFGSLNHSPVANLNARLLLVVPLAFRSAFGAKRTCTVKQNRLNRSKMTHFDVEVIGFAALRRSHFRYGGLTCYDVLSTMFCPESEGPCDGAISSN